MRKARSIEINLVVRVELFGMGLEVCSCFAKKPTIREKSNYLRLLDF